MAKQPFKKEYVKCVRSVEGKISYPVIKKQLAENKQYMAENNLEIFIEPNSDAIKEQLDKDKRALSGESEKDKK